MKDSQKRTDTFKILTILIILLFTGYNIYAMNSFIEKKTHSNQITGNVVNNIQKVKPKVIDVTPKGIPAIYGPELGLNFDDISGNNQQKANLIINKIGSLENKITLTNSEKNRYINIVSMISCEYCCGAESIIFKNGEPACSCAHSAAMRGLAKYLIKYHSNEYTNNEILEELGKLKTLFFPTNIGIKAAILKDKGIELNYVNLASNKYRDIEKSESNQQMVGGC